MAKEVTNSGNDDKIGSAPANDHTGTPNERSTRRIGKKIPVTIELTSPSVTETPITRETAITIDTTDKGPRANASRQQNTYAAKKTVAQGMMDIALITANANQLRYLVEYQRQCTTFYLNVVLITISLLLQIAVGISLIFKGRFDMRGESKFAHARRINNYVVVGIFLVTIINVFVAAFSVSPAN